MLKGDANDWFNEILKDNIFNSMELAIVFFNKFFQKMKVPGVAVDILNVQKRGES